MAGQNHQRAPVFALRRLMKSPVLAAVSLAAAIVIAYGSSLRGDFLWDDDLHITANPTIVGPLGLQEIWTTARANYFPLVLTNFWVQHALWGGAPWGYRVVTLGCHILAVGLLWRVLRQLRVPGAWLGAAIWGLHPVQVESVAWICELKNTQSAVFFLAAVSFYLTGLAARGWSPAWVGAGKGREEAEWPWWREWGGRGPEVAGGAKSGSSRAREAAGGHRMSVWVYAGALLGAVLAILSKPSTVMLPAVLVLVTVGWRGGLSWREGGRLLPFFGFSALAAGWTIWEQQHHSGAQGAAWNQTLAERIVLAGRAIWFYLEKLIWPEPLIFIYPRWERVALGGWDFVPAVAVVAGLGMLGVFWKRWTGWAGIFFAAVFFVVLLFPVLGFFSIYFFRYSFVSDHFQYLASMGPLALVGALLVVGTRRWAPVAGGALLLGLGLMTWRASHAYLDNETLWRATLARNPQALMARLNLGDTLAKKGRWEEAIATFQEVTRRQPDEADAYNDLGGALLEVGRPGEALVALERAVGLSPDRAEFNNNLGNALRRVGRPEEAMIHYRRALAERPDYVGAMNNIGVELAEAGRWDEAVAQFRQARELQPGDAATHDNLGGAYRRMGRWAEAKAAHLAALRLNPQSAETHAHLGRVEVAAGRWEEAWPHFETALRMQPRLAAVRSDYGAALAGAGRREEAWPQLVQAVELAPASAEVRLNLGVALAQAGRVDEALVHLEAAVRLAPRMVVARANLGMALAARSRWADAVTHFAAAQQLRPEDAVMAARWAVALVNAERLVEAVAVFEQALRLAPEVAAVHDDFAQVLRALGRTREAFEQMERAADLRRGGAR